MMNFDIGFFPALLSHFLSGTIDQTVAFTFAHHFQCLVDFYNSYKYSNDQGTTIHVSLIPQRNVNCL